jgi:hypothetical protein
MATLDTITLQYGPMIEAPCPVCRKINLATRRFTLTDPAWTRTVDACSGCGYVFSDTRKAANPLIASGEFECVHAGEVEPGDVLASGETVTSVEHLPFGGLVRITTDQGESERHVASAVLVRVGRTLEYIGERPTYDEDFACFD